MSSGNPYNKINPLSFLIRKVTSKDGRSLFHIDSTDHSAFDMCVFRRHLFDFLMEATAKPFLLWNHGNDYHLEIGAGVDEHVLRNKFRVI